MLVPAVDMRFRAQASVLYGLSVLAGAAIGSQLMSAVGGRFGAQWSFVIAGLLVVFASVRVTKSADAVETDLDRVVGTALDAAELRFAVSKGRRPALLECRHLNFFYGQVQILFDVDFSVDDGEMVALLGTNGAGKSTLLRAISGVGFVERGTVHYQGSEITFLPYDRRVRQGIVQIPGGRAVFGPLTVAENLRAFGFAHGTDRKAAERGIESSYEVFPRLAERRNQPASTLSGGEQQMLGLAKALILKPRLLLIDELSLGLAPRIVGELLEMVRRINSSGTAVVLVEQSVNIALSLVEHAYFMEKGEIRFDGSAEALMARPDLLRAVFLQGASKGTQVADV
jgi:ABC-type branched-subunit amino acid transport system ATPase component